MKLFSVFKKIQKGTTLVELLIYLGLVTVLLGVLTQIFVSILDVQLSSSSVSFVEQDSRFIMSRMSYDIQRADTISIPASPGMESDNLQMMINGISYSYGITDGNLVMSRSGTSYTLNSYNSTVSDVNFKRIGNNTNNDTIQMSFKTNSKILVNNTYESKIITTTFGMR